MPNPVKPYLSVSQQLEHLKAVGMHIEDDATAAGILERVSYYRLINAYGLGLYADKNKSKFREGVNVLASMPLTTAYGMCCLSYSKNSK